LMWPWAKFLFSCCHGRRCPASSRTSTVKYSRTTAKENRWLHSTNSVSISGPHEEIDVKRPTGNCRLARDDLFLFFGVAIVHHRRRSSLLFFLTHRLRRHVLENEVIDLAGQFRFKIKRQKLVRNHLNIIGVK
jgi:hypothetical protein